jgi:hypothetical protein
LYDFRTLSPLDFEELVRDLLQAELGIRFESFKPGKDLGIDFRFASGGGNAVVWHRQGSESSCTTSAPSGRYHRRSCQTAADA